MNLLIVDDEPLIHVSIEYSLREMGDSDLQIFHAYQGADMLQKMEAIEMDIALVDIRMPGMDGLTAINSARQKWPKTHYYIMSGFSEFEYAREAIKLNVMDYLLKPLDPEQLEAVLTRVREEKDRDENQIRESFHAWLVGTLHRHDVSSLFDRSYSAAIVLFSDDSGKSDPSGRISESFLPAQKNTIFIPCWEGALGMIYDQDEKKIKEILHTLPVKKYPEGITCFCSRPADSPEILSDLLHQILAASPIRVFFGIGKLWKLNQLPKLSDSEIVQAKDWIELRDFYHEKRYSDFVSKRAGLISSIRELPESSLRHLACFLSCVTGAKISEPYTPDTLVMILNDAEGSLIRREPAGDRIDAVLDYVRENFCEDISIAKLSLNFDLSPNYLSTLFKKKLGMNFVDYLTELRLAKAKELLLSGNLSVREIGESVGYYSQSYFTKIFIKKEGCTPGEYRSGDSNSGKK